MAALPTQTLDHGFARFQSLRRKYTCIEELGMHWEAPNTVATIRDQLNPTRTETHGNKRSTEQAKGLQAGWKRQEDQQCQEQATLQPYQWRITLK